ncbi:metal-sensing transcriptional repressor [Patescibacteria group bacterium]|nr:metal-sensing transcriptional repressor [Patescibacteria group bacterium]
MEDNRQKALINFKKAQSHVARVIKMIEDGEYCVNIMQQNLAVIGLLKSAHQMLMEAHLSTCFKKAMESGSQKRKQQMVEEILKVTNLFNR